MNRRNFLYLALLTVGGGLASAARWAIPWDRLNSVTDYEQLERMSRPDPRLKVTLAQDPTPDFAKIDKAPGPTYLFTHHHSAYYVIKKLQIEGRLPWRGSVLINFDSHVDAQIPFYVPNPEDRDRELHFLGDETLSPAEKTRRLRGFVRDKLNITSWILPLIDDGSLSAYYYVLPKRYPFELVEKHTAVSQLRKRWADAPSILPGLKAPRIPEGFVFDVVREDTVPPAERFGDRTVILTIDMDYFSCEWPLAGQDEEDVHISTPEEIESGIASALAHFKATGIDPVVVLVSESPGYVPEGQIPLITRLLMPALDKAGFGGR